MSAARGFERARRRRALAAGGLAILGSILQPATVSGRALTPAAWVVAPAVPLILDLVGLRLQFEMLESSGEAEAGFSRAHPRVVIDRCALSPAVGLHVGEQARLEVDFRLSYGVADRGKGVVRFYQEKELIHEEEFLRQGSSHFERRRASVEVVALDTGNSRLWCEVEVHGLRKNWPKDVPIREKDRLQTTIQVDPPYRLELRPPLPLEVSHGDSTTASLVVEIRTQRDGWVDLERTRLNGVSPTQGDLPGNPRQGQKRHRMLVTASRAYEGCALSSGPDFETLLFGVPDFLIVLPLPPGRGGVRREYRFEPSDAAELPPPTVAYSHARLVSCSPGSFFSQEECECIPPVPEDVQDELPSSIELERRREDEGEEVSKEEAWSPTPPQTLNEPRAMPTLPRETLAYALMPPSMVLAGAAATLHGGPFVCGPPSIEVRYGSKQVEVLECAEDRVVIQIPMNLTPGVEGFFSLHSGDLEAVATYPSRLVVAEIRALEESSTDRLLRLRLRLLGIRRGVTLEVDSRSPEDCFIPSAKPLLLETSGGVFNEVYFHCLRSQPGPAILGVRLPAELP